VYSYTKDDWFGDQLILSQQGITGAKFYVSRNHPANGVYKDGYHFSTGDGRLNMVLTDEDMIELFNHFLRMKDEYDNGG
jgi:hypothetical protein